MRKPVLLPLMLALLTLATISCKKQNEAAVKNDILSGQTIAAKILPDQSYVLNFQEAGTVIVARQAAHFAVSETAAAEAGSNPAYIYIPAKGFRGMDEVVLQFSKAASAITTQASSAAAHVGCPGSSSNTFTSVYTTIKITVAD